LNVFSITARIERTGPDRFTVMACAVSNDAATASRGEALLDDAVPACEAQLRVYELVAKLGSQIRRRGDRVDGVRVE
jgi:hypothetical protein